MILLLKPWSGPQSIRDFHTYFEGLLLTLGATWAFLAVGNKHAQDPPATGRGLGPGLLAQSMQGSWSRSTCLRSCDRGRWVARWATGMTKASPSPSGHSPDTGDDPQLPFRGSALTWPHMLAFNPDLGCSETQDRLKPREWARSNNIWA